MRHSMEEGIRKIIERNSKGLGKANSKRKEVVRLYYYKPGPVKGGPRLMENAWVLEKSAEGIDTFDNYNFGVNEVTRKNPLVTCTQESKLHTDSDGPMFADSENALQACMYPGSDIASIAWLDTTNRTGRGTLESRQCTRVMYQCENGHFCSVDITTSRESPKKVNADFYPEPEFFTLSDDIDDRDAEFFKKVVKVVKVVKVQREKPKEETEEGNSDGDGNGDGAGGENEASDGSDNEEGGNGGSDEDDDGQIEGSGSSGDDDDEGTSEVEYSE